MMPADLNISLERMESMLQSSRRRVRAAETSACLHAGLVYLLTGLPAICALFLTFRAIAFISGIPPFVTWVHLLAVSLIFALFAFRRPFAKASKIHTDHFGGAAERLDLSQSTHNRVATALAFLRAGDTSEFATAAIRDGFEHLDRLQEATPHIDVHPSSWRRKATHLAIALLMVICGLFLNRGPNPSGDDFTQVTSLPPVGTGDAADPNTANPELPLSVRSKPPAKSGTPPSKEDAEEKDKGAQRETGTKTRSEGSADQAASGKARSSQSSSSSNSSATGSGAESKPSKPETDKPKKPKKPASPKKQPENPPKPEQQQQKSGSINARGSSGASSMRTTQSKSSTDIKAKADDSDDPGQEEEPDEEIEPDKQRLGSQPTLKSRVSNVSRELSLSMGSRSKNGMRKGRGGPSAAKKTRGTATMIMGVPVPGFVRGRLLPGSTKSTQEEVEPSARAGEYATTTQLEQAKPSENPQPRYRPSAAASAAARDYLIRLHTENENSRKSTTTDE